MGNAPVGEIPPIAGPRRYRATLLLFAVVAAAVVFWFQRHIEPFVNETLIIGGTMSLWGLWKLGWSMYEDASGEKRAGLTRRLLGHRDSLRALTFAAFVVLALHVCTSSITLRYGGARSGDGESFTVRVMSGDEIFLGPFDVTPDKNVAYPMFFRFGNEPLRYEIASPSGFRPIDAKLAPWGAHKYKVPGDFQRKNLHYLYLVPGKLWYTRLPKQGESVGDRYYLTVRSNGTEAQYKDVYRGIMVTGVTSPDLPGDTAIARNFLLRQEVSDYFSDANAVASLMDAPPMGVASPELKAGDVVEVEIGVLDESSTGHTMETRCSIKIPNAVADRHTFMVGPGEKKCA